MNHEYNPIHLLAARKARDFAPWNSKNSLAYFIKRLSGSLCEFTSKPKPVLQITSIVYPFNALK